LIVNILITSANSVAAHQLKNKLNADHVILGDYMDLPEFMVQSGKMVLLPNPKSNAYSHEILTLCLDKNIGSIYPLREEEATLLKEAEQLFKEYNIDIYL
jgi:hypothetical protein